jgi:hypothetical protein
MMRDWAISFVAAGFFTGLHILLQRFNERRDRRRNV